MVDTETIGIGAEEVERDNDGGEGDTGRSGFDSARMVADFFFFFFADLLCLLLISCSSAPRSGCSSICTVRRSAPAFFRDLSWVCGSVPGMIPLEGVEPAGYTFTNNGVDEVELRARDFKALRS